MGNRQEYIMNTPNPEHVARLISTINGSPYFQLLKMRMIEMGIAYSIVEINLARQHLQPFGIVHGGALASLVESATSWAVFYEVEDESAGVTTVDLKLNYLAPATSGRIIARGRRIKLGRTLGYAEAEVTAEGGGLLAHGTSTLMILAGKAPQMDAPSLPKFI
jgi:uncharacterized protein (TIGR00369 family)